MKMLKITIEYGELIIPMKGKPFVDADMTDGVQMSGKFESIDGEKLGQKVFEALDRMAKKTQGVS